MGTAANETRSRLAEEGHGRLAGAPAKAMHAGPAGRRERGFAGHLEENQRRGFCGERLRQPHKEPRRRLRDDLVRRIDEHQIRRRSKNLVRNAG